MVDRLREDRGPFARFSRKDAATLRRWRDDFLPIVEQILIPESQLAAAAAGSAAAAARNEAPKAGCCSRSARSRRSSSSQREFEHPVVQAGLLFFNGLREVDLRCRGFGHHIAALLASAGKAQMCLGGSAALARALVAAVRGERRRDPAADRRRSGSWSRTAGPWASRRQTGERLPRPPLCRLRPQPAADLPRSARRGRLARATGATRRARFQYNLLAPLFALNLNLDEPPRYTRPRNSTRSWSGRSWSSWAWRTSRSSRDRAPPRGGHDSADGDVGRLPDAVRSVAGAARAATRRSCGRSCRTACSGDPRNWDAAKDAHGREMLDLWTQYAPNLEDAVLDWFTRSAARHRADAFPTCAKATCWSARSPTARSATTGRSRARATTARHFQGLYLCGSCCHPGGNVTGLPGYNCAQVLLADLGLPAPWAPEPIEQQWARLTDA